MNVYSHGKRKVLPLLYVDDSPIDRLLVKEAVLTTETPFKFYEAAGVESAKSFFRVHLRDEERRYLPPAVVLLDYDLGKDRGTDFLYWLRVVKRIQSVAVIMFSGSCGKADVEECYAAGANNFVNKPMGFGRIKSIERALFLSVSSSQQQPCALSLLPEFVADVRLHQRLDHTVNLVA
jgi:CheY-like chemotaxis protein